MNPKVQTRMKQLAIGAVAGFAVWYALRHWFEFTDFQSLALALIVVLTWAAIISLMAGLTTASKLIKMQMTPTTDFSPYQVFVHVNNWQDLLLDYKLLNSEEEITQFWKQREDEKSKFVREGFRFTVASLDNDGLPKLIYWDNYKCFTGKMKFEESFGIELPFKSRSGRWSPRIYFGQIFVEGNRAGYGLGLILKEDWWKASGLKSKLPVEENAFTGTVYVLLAVLPFWEIGVRYEAAQRDRKTELEKEGWQIMDVRDAGLDDSSFSVEEKYFGVEQTFLD